MLKFQKKLTSSFLVFMPSRKRDTGRRTTDAGQNPGATKIPLSLHAGDKKSCQDYQFVVQLGSYFTDI